MNNYEIDEKLKRAVEHATPDLKKRVMDACQNANKNGTTVIIKNRRSRTRERLYGIIAIAAMLLLVCNVALDFAGNINSNRVETVVDIDVNPGIELKINSDDRIVMAYAVNEDAVEILDGMDLTGTQTQVAVNAIVGSLFAHGYLTGETDSILVSVENKDADKSAEIRENITEDIDSILRAYSADVSIIGQIYEENTEIVTMSDTYGISEGKATLIQKISENTDAYSLDELALFNIAELNDILCSLETVPEATTLIDTAVTGSVSMNVTVDEPTVSENKPEAVSEPGNEDDKDNENDAADTDDTEEKESVSENAPTVSISQNSVSDNSASNDNQETTVSQNEI